jgi:ATP-dependent helicase YprA (DUF1998 family)
MFTVCEKSKRRYSRLRSGYRYRRQVHSRNSHTLHKFEMISRVLRVKNLITSSRYSQAFSGASKLLHAHDDRESETTTDSSRSPSLNRSSHGPAGVRSLSAGGGVIVTAATASASSKELWSSISQRTRDSLSLKGITELFPIQAACWKHAAEGKDIVARARTGTGKTLAYALPLIERLNNRPEKSDIGRGRRTPR